jgi:hypothetical protein
MSIAWLKDLEERQGKNEPPILVQLFLLYTVNPAHPTRPARFGGENRLLPPSHYSRFKNPRSRKVELAAILAVFGVNPAHPKRSGGEDRQRAAANGCVIPTKGQGRIESLNERVPTRWTWQGKFRLSGWRREDCHAGNSSRPRPTNRPPNSLRNSLKNKSLRKIQKETLTQLIVA